MLRALSDTLRVGSGCREQLVEHRRVAEPALRQERVIRDDSGLGPADALVEALRIAAGMMTNGVVLLTGGAAPDLDGGSGGTAVNAALAAFVTAARRELPDGVRAHVIAPGWVTESIPPDWDIPHSVPAAEVASTYRHALATSAVPAVLTVP